MGLTMPKVHTNFSMAIFFFFWGHPFFKVFQKWDIVWWIIPSPFRHFYYRLKSVALNGIMRINVWSLYIQEKPIEKWDNSLNANSIWIFQVTNLVRKYIFRLMMHEGNLLIDDSSSLHAEWNFQSNHCWNGILKSNKQVGRNFL